MSVQKEEGERERERDTDRYLPFVCKHHQLDTGVVLDVVIGCGPRIPVGAGVVDVGHVLESGDLGLALDQLQSEALVGVPCDVAYGRKELLVM